MVLFHRAPERTGHRGALLLAVVAGVLVALSAASIAETSAAFTSGVDAATAQSGSIRLAQGPTENDRYPDPAHPHDITVDSGGAQKISYLPAAPTGPPSVATASFTVTAHLLTSSRDVVLRAKLHDTASEAPWLLFDVRAKGASLLPSAIPLTADGIAALDDGAGLRLPTPDVGTGLAITVRVWLAPTAPPAAFNAKVTPAIAITAETVGGRTVSLEEELR